MKALLQRIAALERQHQVQRLFFAGMVEGIDRADAVRKATGPGLYMRPVEPGNSIELLVIDRVAGQLALVAVHLPGDAATPASTP